MLRTVARKQEYQYLSLIRNILNVGEKVKTRNGITRSIIGANMRFTLENNNIPLLTTKKIGWRTCLRELLWFIRGDTNNENLQNHGVHIWDVNASRENLDMRGLGHLKEGDLGPIYGHQWRHYNAKYKDAETDYKGKGIDQLEDIISKLKCKESRYSRRLLMTAWNPEQISEMALPPCHVMVQFNVLNEDLYCSMYQRSGDVGLGIPFNIASYSFLTHIIANITGLKAKSFNYHIGNAHIYEDHISALKEQITRVPLKPPKIKILQRYSNINDYSEKDIEIHKYIYGNKIQMMMKP
jgi:thymidylate synthase